MNPLVTCILLAYNQENFVENAVKSILDQDYSNIEFILSDDASSDKTFEIISKVSKEYSTSKNIILNKNKENLGIALHFNKLVKLSKGQIIVVAAGDDISLKDRVSKSVKIFNNHNDVKFISFNDHDIDNHGNFINYGSRVKHKGIKKYDLNDLTSCKNIPFSGASRAFRKEIYDFFGPLNSNCPSEDTPYIIRGLIMGKTAISSDIGIYYRRHHNNLSQKLSLSETTADLITKQYIDDYTSADSKGILSKKDKLKLIKWIEGNKIRRTKLTELRLTNIKAKYFFQHVLSLPNTSYREKLSILKQIILKRF